jgi:hypothetical protein
LHASAYVILSFPFGVDGDVAGSLNSGEESRDFDIEPDTLFTDVDEGVEVSRKSNLDCTEFAFAPTGKSSSGMGGASDGKPFGYAGDIGFPAVLLVRGEGLIPPEKTGVVVFAATTSWEGEVTRFFFLG